MQKKVDQASVPSIASSPIANITVFESMFVAKKAGMKFFWEYIQMALPNETSSLTNKDLLLFFGQYIYAVQQLEVATEISTVAFVKKNLTLTDEKNY